MRLPAHPADLSPAWLTAALRRGGEDRTVVDVAIVGVHDATNLHASIDVTFDDVAAPTRLFVKLPPADPERRARLDWASMGLREVRFYRDLAPRIALRVPVPHVAEIDHATGEFVLVLEHLDGPATALADVLQGIDPDLALVAVRDLAALHARFEDPSARLSGAPWLRPSGRSSDYGARLLREGIDDPVAPLGDGFVAVAEHYIRHRDQLQDAWEEGPATVLHGDPHVGNVFVARGDPGEDARLGFYAWGLMVVGSPLRDISYLLTMCLSPANRADHERELLSAYLSARDDVGAMGIDPADAWLWHRVQSAYTVVASCQSIRADPTASPGRRAFSAAFVERATAAVDDLDPLEALARIVDR